MPRPQAILAAVLLAVLSGTAQAGTVIDSFTHAYPPHDWLPVTQRPILFLGTVCDGPSCPPFEPVPREYTDILQSGVTGAISPWRDAGLYTSRAFVPGVDHAVARIDPANDGSLILEERAGGMLILSHTWGTPGAPLNVDLRADGSDRFEIDILAGPEGDDAIEILVVVASAGSDVIAERQWFASGAGTVSIPYESIAELADVEKDVDFLQLVLFVENQPEVDVVLGEFRTASDPTPAAPSSWGRIKDAYRR